MKFSSKLRSPVFLVSTVVICCVILLAVNVYELHWMQAEHLKFHHEESTEMRQTTFSTSSFHPNGPVFLAFGRDVSWFKNWLNIPYA